MNHKETEGKLQLNLVPPRAIEIMTRVREFGGIKYKDPWDWVKCVPPEQLVEAAKRHILKMDKAYDIMELDEESGLPHMAHALCSLAMALEIVLRKKEKEDEINTK